MINIDGIEYRTAAQWEKKHRHVLKGQLKKGVERSWRSPNGNETMMFYSVEQTRPWAKKDVEAVNRRRRADAKAKRDAEECERIEGAARAEQHRKDLLDCWGAHIDEETLQEGRRDHTAYQWCDLGFVPIAEARWRLTRYGGNSAWYYCSPWDVRYDPDRAKELLETGPREYDRLPDVSLAVSTRLPASPVDLASVVNIDNKDDENIVLDIGDYPIVTDPVAPET